MSEFLAMGGYGAYVWPSYALAALLQQDLSRHDLSALRCVGSTGSAPKQ